LKKKLGLKVLSSMTMTAMLASTLAFASNAPATVNAVEKANVNHSHGGAPFDLGVANDERLIEMLKKNGTLAKDASPKQAELALQKYLKAKADSASREQGDLDKQDKALKDTLKENLKNNSLTKGKGNKLGQTKGTVETVKAESWDGGVRQDDILVVLIEYPDSPASNIGKDDTDMYYDSYTKEHYKEMLFGDEKGFYKGPNGEKLVSVKKFYEEQSGGSYTIGGDVVGWYKASKPAAYYGGNVPAPDGSDAKPRELVKEAVRAAAANGINLSEYDKEDRYDLDGDGNLREPDGLIDHLMIVHSSVGEEAGGGKLGGDAIWSHRWNLGGVSPVAGTQAQVPYWGGMMAAYDYTIEPADGAAGVFAHEYGHDLELPDEYDTQYSGAGEAVAYWSIMSSGSWAGKIPGTEPTGFSPWAKEFLQGYVGGNWLTGSTVNLDDVDSKGVEILLDEGVTKGTNNDAVKIQLPDKLKVINKPFSGTYEYFSGSGNDLDNSMSVKLDLSGAEAAELNFKTWYQIEVDWDYASVQVKEEGSNEWVAIPGNLTTDSNPHDQNPGHGITGYSDGWVDANFDLSAYAGKKIDVKLNYWTDVAASEAGFYVDDINVTVDGQQVVFDDAEGDSTFALDGFKKDKGEFFSEHYYLLEWRSHNGVDEGLKNIRRGASLMSYDQGLLVWYVDNSYDNNWTGLHPGEGFLGVVDADQHTLSWSDKTVGSTRYQVHDAAFGLDKTEKMFLDYPGQFTMKDNFTQRNPLFDDSADYSNPGLVDAGRNVPNYGLKFRVVGQSADGTVGKVLIFK
jgi:immune inhibitor A